MTRKRQTTPLPKAPSKRTVKAQPVQPTRMDRLMGRDPNRELSRAEREAALQRRIYTIIGAAVAVVAVLIIVAVVTDVLIRPRQIVATVNDESISVGDYQQRVRIERALQIELLNDALNDFVEENLIDVNTAAQYVLQQSPYAEWWNELNTPDVMGLRVLDDMIDDRLIAAEAEELGITVTDEDVNSYINGIIGYDPEAVAAIGTDPTETPMPTSTPTPFVSPTPSPSPTPTAEPTAEPTTEGTPDEEPPPTATATVTAAPTEAQPTRSPEEVRERFENQRSLLVTQISRQSGASEQAVIEFLRTLALREAVADQLTGSTEDEQTTLYADARHILVETEEEAQDALDALNAGESFSDLAKAVSTDTGSGAVGGELDWAPIARYVEPFANAIRDAEIGEVVGPVESQFGFHIIQVRAKENREADETEINRAKQIVLQAWLQEVRAEHEGEFETTNEWADNIPQSPIFVYRER